MPVDTEDDVRGEGCDLSVQCGRQLCGLGELHPRALSEVSTPHLVPGTCSVRTDTSPAAGRASLRFADSSSSAHVVGAAAHDEHRVPSLGEAVRLGG